MYGQSVLVTHKYTESFKNIQPSEKQDTIEVIGHVSQGQTYIPQIALIHLFTHKHQSFQYEYSFE